MQPHQVETSGSASCPTPDGTEADRQSKQQLSYRCFQKISYSSFKSAFSCLLPSSLLITRTHFLRVVLEQVACSGCQTFSVMLVPCITVFTLAVERGGGQPRDELKASQNEDKYCITKRSQIASVVAVYPTSWKLFWGGRPLRWVGLQITLDINTS